MVERVTEYHYDLYIGFCGEIYHCYVVKMPRNYTQWSKYLDYHHYDFYYNVNDFIDGNIKTKDKNIIKLFKRDENLKIKHMLNIIKKFNLFAKYKTPVFMMYTHNYDKEYNVIINPKLEDVQFHKLFNGMQTYQEIEMYIGSMMLQREMNGNITDDKILALNHGFDKWSFRKRPKNLTKGN